MFRTKNRKLIALILCIATLITSVPMVVNANNEAKTTVTLDGEDVTSVTITTTEALELEAKTTLGGEISYQWQIFAAEEDLWVDIYEETSASLTVSIGLVEHVLGGSDTAYVRVVASNGTDETVSEKVSVTVDGLTAMSRAALEVADKPDEEEPEEDTVHGYFLITISYIFESGQLAYQKYVASIAPGEALKTTIINPTVIGYLPYVDGKQVDSVTIDIAKATENVDYTVVYKPVEVDYKVSIFLQNTTNDLYTEDATLATSWKGLAETYTPNDDIIAAYEEKMDGFYVTYNESIMIAPDGSTILPLYYDRYYYLVFFDTDGGYGTDPVYARYGTDITVRNPSRSGYTFAGWSLTKGGDITDTPQTVPASNVTYFAVWTQGDATYTVVYWKENADDSDYTYWVSEQKPASTGSTVSAADTIPNSIAGSDRTYFTFDKQKSDKYAVVQGDGSTIVNAYYKRNTYTIQFKATGRCVLEQHTHGSACVGCGYENHVHSLSCYNFGSYNVSTTASTRSSNYLRTTANGLTVYYRTRLNSTTYYVQVGNSKYQINNYNSSFDGKQTCGKVAHQHGESCYVCGLIEHTHTTNCTNSYRENVIYVVTRKYGASIADIWDQSTGFIGKNYDGYRWYSSINTSYFYTFLDRIPSYDLVLSGDKSDSTKKTWYYYLEVLPGQDTKGLTLRTYGGKTYYLYHTCSVAGIGNLTYDEDYFDIKGFTQLYAPGEGGWSGDSMSFSNGIAYLYYTRNVYKLDFINYNTTLVAKSVDLLYEQSLKNEFMEPDYPTTLEEGGYEFAGWYTTEECFDGTEVDFDKETMPDGNVGLYAKYTPKMHRIRVYMNSDLEDLVPSGKVTIDGVEVTFNNTQYIYHGDTMVGTLPTEGLENEGLNLAGWFYMENGVKKGYDPRMPIRKDMDIFAEWKSDKVVPYTVKYCLEDGTPIADDSTGFGLAGRSKVFQAKVEVEWFPEYREAVEEHLFPQTNSHTIFLSATGDNVFTFYYKYVKDVPYTVNYLSGEEENYGTKLADSVKKTTDICLVEEEFKVIPGYVPDSFSKQLIICLDEELNVIDFYYTKDSSHAIYQVSYFYQNTDGEGYSLAKSIEYLGDINTEVTSKVLSERIEPEGFTYNEKISVIPTGTLTAAGMKFEFYYDRDEVGYTVKYLDFDTSTPVKTEKSGTGLFGATVSEDAATVEGYELVGTATTKTKELVLDEEKNVIEFYYSEKYANISYVRVVKDASGKAKAYGYDDEVEGAVLSNYSENIKVKTGTPQTSTATATDGLVFSGWFTDEACETAVDTSLVSGTKLTPGKTDGLYADTTYYALFVTGKTKITITHSGAKEETDVFFYHVVGDSVDVIVPVHGDEPTVVADIPIGEYTVTEMTDWSWRYTPKAASVTKEAGEDAKKNVYAFEVKSYTGKWLGDSGSVTNVFD